MKSQQSTNEFLQDIALKWVRVGCLCMLPTHPTAAIVANDNGWTLGLVRNQERPWVRGAIEEKSGKVLPQSLRTAEGDFDERWCHPCG